MRARTGLATFILALLLLPSLAACSLSPRAGGRRLPEQPSQAIVFVRGTDIWMVKPDGSGEMRLTATGNRKSYPRVAPDGTYVLFTLFPGVDDTAQAKVCRLELAGLSQPARSFDTVADGFAPCFDPSGNVYFARTEVAADGRRHDEIYLLEAGRPRKLTDLAPVQDGGEGLAIKYMAAAPDGEWLGFVRGRSGGSRWVAMLQLRGGAVRNADTPPAMIDESGKGTVDGAFAFFDSTLLLVSHGALSASGLQESHRVFRVKPATGEERRLTPGPDDLNPALSADGQRMAFERNGRVFTADSYGAGEAQLAEGREPSWGEGVIFTAQDDPGGG